MTTSPIDTQNRTSRTRVTGLIVRHKRLLIDLLLVAIFLLGCRACVNLFLTLLDARLMSVFAPPPEFCTLEDEVYQTVAANADDWVEVFRSRGSSFGPNAGSLEFSVPSGKIYYVTTHWWNYLNPQELPVLRVVINWHLRDIGEGYVYWPSGDPTIGGAGVKYLGASIYCFTFNERYNFE